MGGRQCYCLLVDEEAKAQRNRGAVQGHRAGSGGAGTQVQVYLISESELPLKSDFLFQGHFYVH